MSVDITPYVERLRADLLAAAEGAGPDVAHAATRLGYAIDPAVRLALMEALSHAAAEITAEMDDGAVDVRLDGRELAFVVQRSAAPDVQVLPPVPATDDDEKSARITLRLPESVKAQAEEAASAQGQSLNTWLGQVVHAAAQGTNASDPFAAKGSPRNRQMRGWV